LEYFIFNLAEKDIRYKENDAFQTTLDDPGNATASP
jgi:hypothetical protein